MYFEERAEALNNHSKLSECVETAFDYGSWLQVNCNCENIPSPCCVAFYLCSYGPLVSDLYCTLAGYQNLEGEKWCVISLRMYLSQLPILRV